MSKRIDIDKRLLAAKNMPPLERRKNGEEYDYKNDEVLKWISEQPQMMDYLLGVLQRRGCVEFNSVNGTWQGVNYTRGGTK